MPGQEPIHLFVYGTLMDPQRVEALTGKRFAWVEATLVGFERRESDLGYPYIRPQAGSVVHGILLTDIDAHSLQQLDAYEAEGDLYRRQAVEVLVAGVSRPAMAYVGHAIGAPAPQGFKQQRDGEAARASHDATATAAARVPCP
jgi:gamma-glutamylcyclotransferase (GGCT)/AIG2-like uncharacterized protein YtfP